MRNEKIERIKKVDQLNSWIVAGAIFFLLAVSGLCIAYGLSHFK